MTQSIIFVNNSKTVAKTQTTSYNIKGCLEAMDNWFKQDKDFMKNLISKAVEYEQNSEISFISHEGFSSNIIYSWPTFFSKFKPSITNYERTKSRIEKGQILYKTENQTPNFYYVGASHYEGDNKPVLDGFHTRAMEAIARILGLIEFKEGVDKRSYMKNVIVLTFKKSKEEFANHTDIVVNQDSYLNVMDKKMTNKILAAELEDSFIMLHPFAQSQSARKMFADYLKIENTINVFNDDKAKKVLTTMISSTIAMMDKDSTLDKNDVDFKLWNTAQNHLTYEGLSMPESVYAGIMIAAYKLMSGKTPSSLKDVLDTVTKFMTLDFNKFKEYQQETGSVTCVIIIAQIEDSIKSRTKPGEMINKNTSSQTLANYAGTLIRDSVIKFHDVKEGYETSLLQK